MVVKGLNVGLVVNRRTMICREFQFSVFYFLHTKDNLIGNLLVKCILVFVLFTILQKCHQTPDLTSDSDV